MLFTDRSTEDLGMSKLEQMRTKKILSLSSHQMDLTQNIAPRYNLINKISKKFK